MDENINVIKDDWKVCAKHKKYECNSDGEFRNIATKRILCQYINRKGYKTVVLSDFKKMPRKYNAHRIIAETFIPNPNNYGVVNHKDENKLNNKVSNLEWCTNKYNLNYSNTGQKIREKLIHSRIFQCDEKGNVIKIWDCAKDVRRAGFTQIYKTLRFSPFYEKGYYWFKEGKEININK